MAEQIHIQLQFCRTLLVIGTVWLLGYGLWRLPIVQVSNRLHSIHATLLPKELLDAENAARTTLAQIVGGFAVLLGAYLTFRNIRAVEKNLTISQEGQITERFTRAIEQLGSDKNEVVLGGIYGLERTAQDSERDHWPVVEVLLAYIHSHAPLDKLKEREQLKEQKAILLPADVQSALTVLARRDRSFDPPNKILDLRGLYLGGAQLEDAKLQDADLRESRLLFANLTWAKLEGSILCGTYLIGANLSNAVLKDADAQGAHFQEATLTGADMRGMKLDFADMSGAYLKGARLEGVDLKSVKGLSKPALSQAITNGKTVLPEYLQHNGDAVV